jgi:hypothetical protein
VLQILREFVSVAPAANRESQRDKCKNVRLEELPHRNVHLGIMRDHSRRALILLPRPCRYGKFVVQAI